MTDDIVHRLRRNGTLTERLAAEEITRLRRQNEELREALKPFAIEFDGKWTDADELSVWKGGQDTDRALGLFVLTVGDHRRARAVLASQEEKQDGS
jgi:hypothetical protein